MANIPQKHLIEYTQISSRPIKKSLCSSEQARIKRYAMSGAFYLSVTLTTNIATPTYIATAVGAMNMITNGLNILLNLVLGITREILSCFGPRPELAALPQSDFAFGALHKLAEQNKSLRRSLK